MLLSAFPVVTELGNTQAVLTEVVGRQTVVPQTVEHCPAAKRHELSATRIHEGPQTYVPSWREPVWKAVEYVQVQDILGKARVQR